MHLEYRHSPTGDRILFVDSVRDLVCSDFEVNKAAMEGFCNCLPYAGSLLDASGSQERRSDDYGRLIAVRQGYGLEVIDEHTWKERVEFFINGELGQDHA